MSSLLARVPAAFYRCAYAPDLPVRCISDSVPALVGCEAGRLLGESGHWLEFIEPEDRGRFESKFRTLESFGVYEDSYRLRCGGGNVVMVADYAEVREGMGARWVEGIIWRKAQTESAFLTEERCHQILDALADMVLVKGPASRIVWANRAFCDYYGMTVAELRGTVDASFNDPRNTARYERDDAYVFRTGRALHIAEEPVTRHDGSVRLFETVKTPIFDASRKVAMTVGVSRDISERKKAEAELRRSQTFLQSIVDNIPNMIFVKDARDLRFVRLNLAGEELLGKSDYDFFPKQEADFFVEKDREVLRSGRLVDIPEEPIVTRQKGTRYLHTKKIPICDEAGVPRYLAGISEDITEQKAAAEALRAARDELEERVKERTAELAEVNKQQELLLSELDHRVKNMLNLVLSLAKQSMRRARDLKSFERAFVGRLAGLAEVHKMLRRNRWEGVSLQELAKLCFQLAAAGASSHISLQGPDLTLEPKIAQTLYMALYELATNAIKYGALSCPEGKLELHWHLVTDSERQDLELLWHESCGPRVLGAAGSGFGRTLLERIIPFELGGSSSMNFKETGLECEMHIPLTH